MTNNFLPRTAEIVVTYPSVSVIENRQEQEGSQKQYFNTFEYVK